MTTNGKTPRNPLAARLAASATTDIEGLTAHWRCRVLSPTEAVELQAGLGMLQAAVSAAREREPDEDPKPTPSQQVAIVSHMEALACAVVRESSESGSTWHPIRLVQTVEQQDVEVDPPRLYIGVINPADLASIAFAATATYREARTAAMTFPKKPDAPARARRSRKKVRPDAG